MKLVAQSPLTFASFQKCSRELVRGELKRVVQRGPLVGYFMACPACGFSASYLESECGFIEEPVIVEGKSYMRAVGVTRPPPCFKCRCKLTITDGNFEAYDDTPGT